jgi:hypothetical protein
MSIKTIKQRIVCGERFHEDDNYIPKYRVRHYTNKLLFGGFKTPLTRGSASSLTNLEKAEILLIMNGVEDYITWKEFNTIMDIFDRRVLNL